MQEFLNPKSMVTPGVAGALLMFLVNGVCFSFPEMAPRYVALILSFIIGGIAFSAAQLKFLERSTYWILNSLIIFTMGTGAAKLAAQTPAAPPAPVAVTAPAAAQHSRAAFDWLIPAAHADGMPADAAAAAPGQAPVPTDPAALQLYIAEQQKQIAALKQENSRLNQVMLQTAPPPAAAAAAPAPRTNSFFKEW